MLVISSPPRREPAAASLPRLRVFAVRSWHRDKCRQNRAEWTLPPRRRDGTALRPLPDGTGGMFTRGTGQPGLQGEEDLRRPRAGPAGREEFGGQPGVQVGQAA